MSDTPEWPDVIGSGSEAPSKLQKAHPVEVSPLDLILENRKLQSRVRQLERELAEATTGLKDGQAAYDAALTKATCLRNELLSLREGVEKLAAEYTRLADTSDDEDFITEKRALARELRALIK